MDFARNQLLKYGWTEGKGLGRNETGIAEAIKPTLKFDTAGVGHDSSEQFTFNWWENVYNQAADNIKVETTNSGSVNVKLKSEDSVDITTKKYSYKHLKKKNVSLEYGSFMKTSKLTSDGLINYEDNIIYATSEPDTVKVANLTDEEIFAACGGRTAHKGARHGLRQMGKLARIQEQEMLLLQKMKQQANDLSTEENKMDHTYYSYSDNSEYQSQEKIKKKNKAVVEIEIFDVTEDKKQKKAKKRKHSQSYNLDEELNNYIDEETACKRTEDFCYKKEKKKMKILKKKEAKRIDKMANMLENVCVLNSQQDNKDDGFVENINEEDCAKETKKKHKKKKRKLNDEGEKADECDDGFEECINEVSEKLIHYKELRRDLQNEKRKVDEKRISKISADFERTL